MEYKEIRKEPLKSNLTIEDVNVRFPYFDGDYGKPFYIRIKN